MKRFLLLMFLVTLIISCSKSDVSDENIEDSDQFIVGYTSDFDDILCYVEDSSNEQLMFTIATLFAVNIDYDSSKQKPVISPTPEIKQQLENQETIQKLKDNGVKVLATVLGNHEKAGWSCFAKKAAAESFVEELQNFMNKYNLDGIDIDDEYSTCLAHVNSLAMVSTIFKDKMPDKMLTIALVYSNDFIGVYKGKTLAENIDYGWDAGYKASDEKTTIDRLNLWLDLNLKKEQLAILMSKTYTPGGAESAAVVVRTLKANGYSGYGVFNDKPTYAIDYLEPMYEAFTDKKLLDTCK